MALVPNLKGAEAALRAGARKLTVPVKPVPQFVALGWPGTAGAAAQTPPVLMMRRIWPAK